MGGVIRPHLIELEKYHGLCAQKAEACTTQWKETMFYWHNYILLLGLYVCMYECVYMYVCVHACVYICIHTDVHEIEK